MNPDYKVGESIEVLYVPGNFQSGQIDCKVDIFDENGDILVGSPFTMIEKDDGVTTPEFIGVYAYSFIPDEEGIWAAKVYRLVELEKKFAKVIKYKVKLKDITDLIDDVEDIQGTSFDSGTDSLKAIRDAIDEISEGGQVL